MRRKTIRRATRWVLGVSILVATVPYRGACQQPAGANTPSGVAPAPNSLSVPTQKMTLADFTWLVGRWQGTWGPRVAQQAWMPPRAGVMLGSFQLTENGKALVIELFTLVEKPDGIHFYLRHFTPSLAAWEKTDPAVLNLRSIDPKTAIFENPGDGQPRRALFKRIDADTYVARSEVVRDKGDTQVTEITYRRQKDARSSRH